MALCFPTECPEPPSPGAALPEAKGSRDEPQLVSVKPPLGHSSAARGGRKELPRLADVRCRAAAQTPGRRIGL